eukprot:491254_1
MVNKISADVKTLKLWKEYEFFLSTGYEISYQNFIRCDGDADKCIKYIEKQKRNKPHAIPKQNNENKANDAIIEEKQTVNVLCVHQRHELSDSVYVRIDSLFNVYHIWTKNESKQDIYGMVCKFYNSKTICPFLTDYVYIINNIDSHKGLL